MRGIGLVSSCSGLRVQLISEPTVDAGLGLAVVEVDVHPGVAKGAAATIARHLEMTKLGMIPCGGRVNGFMYSTLNFCIFRETSRYIWSKKAYKAGGNHLDRNFLDQVLGPLRIHLQQSSPTKVPIIKCWHLLLLTCHLEPDTAKVLH